MSKVIKSTKECGYHKEICGKHYCEHPALLKRYCTWENAFPNDCPLPNGIKTKEAIGHVAAMCKAYNTLYGKIHKHKEPKKK